MKRAIWVLAILTLTLAVSTVVVSQLSANGEVKAPSVTWEKTPLSGDGYSVYPLSNGFVFSAANTSATLLVKTDSSGNIAATKAVQINGETTLLPYLVPTLDGGYAFAGVFDNKFALLKTDAHGNVQWSHLYQSEAPINYFRSIIQTRNGNFILAGFGAPAEESEGWIWLAKTDSEGKLIWNKTLADPLADCPSSIIELPSGELMLSDVSYSIVPNQAFIRLIRIDPDGRVLWNQTYGGEGAYAIPECNNAIQTDDGGFLVSGFLSGRNAWVVKTDAAGQMEWNRTYGGKHAAMVCAHQLDDGYVIAGVLNQTQAWLVRTDKTGNMHWNLNFTDATFPVGLEANFNSVLPTQDGGYVVLGSKNGSVWFLKLAPTNAVPPILGWVLAAATCATALITVAVYFREKTTNSPPKR